MKGLFSGKKMPKEKAQNLLLEGVRRGNLEQIDKALEAGADIDHRYAVISNSNGDLAHVEHDVSAVYIALLENRADMAMALLKRGANPLEPGCGGTSSPIHEAVHRSAYEFINATAADGYRLKDLPASSENPIFLANANFLIKALKTLVAAGADVNSYDSKKTTPLYNILMDERFDKHWGGNQTQINAYIHALFDAGADIYARTPEGKALSEDINSFLFSLVTDHMDRLRQNLICEHGAGMEPQRLIKDGAPTPELLRYCGANMLPDLFSQYRWHGKESQALALFDEARAALPDYYKPRMDEVDLSALRREASGQEKGSAVKRYVRQPSPTEVKR